MRFEMENVDHEKVYPQLKGGGGSGEGDDDGGGAFRSQWTEIVVLGIRSP